MKVVLIVQARMGSSRLPGKVLLTVAGRPMLAHQIDRLLKVRYADQIVIATSTEPADDAIVKFCEQIGISVFRGDENDVLSRFVGAAVKYEADVIGRLTADCPLIDPAVIDQVISSYFEDPHERVYVSNTFERTFPRGMDIEVFSRVLLFEAGLKATSKRDREHVTPFLIRNEQSDITQRNISCWKNLSAYRFTLDYQKDYTQISAILESDLPNFSLGTLMQRASTLGLDSHDNNEILSEKLIPGYSRTTVRSLLSRFGLGTAQFGMFYGRFNRDGVPSRDAACEILSRGTDFGLSCIDTAHLYGESEAVLGSCTDALNSYAIFTKTPHFPNRNINGEDARLLRETFFSSLRLMGKKSIDGLLIHHAPNLLSEGGELLYRELVCIKEDGFVKNIGVSAYTGEIVEAIQHKFPLDFVQLPINLLDRRLIETGSLGRIVKSGTKIHARSAFMQGLLLTDPQALTAHFQPVRETLAAFHAASKSAGVTPAHAALHYLLAIPEIDKVIVGVESVGQLHEIFSNFPEKVDMNYDKFRVDSIEILNPILWKN